MTNLSTGQRFRIPIVDGPAKGRWYEFDEFAIRYRNISSLLRRLICRLHLMKPKWEKYMKEQYPPHSLTVPMLNPTAPHTKVTYQTKKAKIEVGRIPAFDQIRYELDMEDGVYRLRSEK